VFEAAAAAACHIDSATPRSAAMIVLDVGAGTTDIGAIGFDADRAWEIQDVRRTVNYAGDAIDAALANILIDRANLRIESARSRAWRELMIDVRAGKETLFAKGRATFQFGGRTARLSLKDLLADAEARAVIDAIRDAYDSGLQQVVQAAEEFEGQAVTAVAAGGGANIPAVRQILRSCKPRRSKIRIDYAPTVPAWAQSEAYGGALTASFPMLSIAIGGALASPSLVST